MIEIPVAIFNGIAGPARPIPGTALAVVCDGQVYRVAETPAEAAAIAPPAAQAANADGATDEALPA